MLRPELIEEAKRNPGGWVYEIVGQFGPDEHVPPTAIRGAWQVDAGGQIVGDFVPNPEFAQPPPGGDQPPPDQS